MSLYRVLWEIEIDAETPREAAEKAMEVHRDPDSTATVFDVSPRSHAGQTVTIDLSDHVAGNAPKEEEEAVPAPTTERFIVRLEWHDINYCDVQVEVPVGTDPQTVVEKALEEAEQTGWMGQDKYDDPGPIHVSAIMEGDKEWDGGNTDRLIPLVYDHDYACSGDGALRHFMKDRVMIIDVLLGAAMDDRRSEHSRNQLRELADRLSGRKD